ncbi:hypothetical protein [Cellulomonas algicola]|uniref:hypothetical protein n=1 Tax=Cellulomonas algicola TaxID=2071633 RepID=UPI000F58D973|nr:hypothetical protein [Cellulomonas algicola]
MNIYVDFHQFTVVADDAWSDEVPLQPSPGPLALLFEPRTTRAAVLTGIATGPVKVTVAALTSPPIAVDDTWEDVAEVSLEVANSLEVSGWGGTEGAALGRLNAAGPGSYRVRVHANGRDRSSDLAVGEPVEQYLIVAWPAPAEPPRSLRSRSTKALEELSG